MLAPIKAYKTSSFVWKFYQFYLFKMKLVTVGKIYILVRCYLFFLSSFNDFVTKHDIITLVDKFQSKFVKMEKQKG